MTEVEKKKWYKRVAFAGVVLGIVCHLLPPQYHAVCQAVANVCTGGF